VLQRLRASHGHRELRELLDAVRRRRATLTEAADRFDGGAAAEEGGDEPGGGGGGLGCTRRRRRRRRRPLQPLLEQRQQQLEELLSVLLLSRVEAQGPHERARIRGATRGSGLHGCEEAAEGADGGVASGGGRRGRGAACGARGVGGRLLLLRGFVSSSPAASGALVEPLPERRVGEEALERAGDVASGPEVEEPHGDGSLGGGKNLLKVYFGIFEFFFLHLARQQGKKTALSNSSLHLFLLLLRCCRLRLCFRGLGPEPDLPVGPGGRSQPPDAARGGAPAGASPGGSRRGGERPSDSGDGGAAAALARVRRPGRVAGPAAVEGREEGVDPGVLTRAEDFERFLGLVGEGDRGRDEVGEGRE